MRLKLFIFLSIVSGWLPSFANIGDTTKSNASLKVGIEKLHAQKFSESIIEFNKAIKENRSNWKAYRFKGEAEYMLDDFKSSVKDYSTALQLFPSDTLSYRGRAEALRMSGKYQEAIPDYNIALTWRSNDYYLHVGRGLCEFEGKKYSVVIDDMSIYIANTHLRGPTYIQALRCRGFSYFYDRKFKLAINDFKKEIGLGNSREDFLPIGRGFYYLANENVNYLDSAIKSYKRASPYVKDAFKIPYYLGEAYSDKGDLEMAEDQIKKALSINPKDPDALYILATIKLRQRKFDDGYVLFKKYTDIVKEPKQGVRYLYWGIAKWGAKQDTAGALQDFEMASKLGGVEKGIFDNQFLLLFGNPTYTLATKGYITNEIAKTKDSLKLSYLYTSRSLVNAQMNNLSEAQIDIKTALKCYSQNPVGYLALGFVDQRVGLDSKIVLENYDKATTLNNKFGEAYLMKAYFVREQKDLKAACDNLSKAEQLGIKSTETLKEYICEGKTIASSKESATNFVLYPYLRNTVSSMK